MFNIIPLKIKLIIGFLIIFIIVLTASLSIAPQPQELPTPSVKPSSTTIPLYQEPNYTGPEPSSVSQTSTPESERIAQINELNGELLQKLPFTGKNFSLRYDGNTNKFIASYTKGSEQSGKDELLQFLKANGIESADWLTNFTTETQ